MRKSKEIVQAIIKAKEQGLSDVEIGRRFGVSFKQLERILTEHYGANISSRSRTKRIKYWSPRGFSEERTTVWSFKNRGDWATHNPSFRGNWSPYIPRNIILKYSQPGDVVLDYFVGGGTTAIEAKLLGRRCIARDINPVCVQLTLSNLKFDVPQGLFPFPVYEPEVSVGDARDLSDIPDESIDLICAHPPYAGIINYSSGIEGDLSNLGIEDFLREMGKVAEESYRVLKPGKKCALLIGDTRRRKHIVPLGFKLIDIFLKAGFVLKELVIKRQHNCKTTGFWYERSLKYNFLLLAHEYLPIFEKPSQQAPVLKDGETSYCTSLFSLEDISAKKIEHLESSSVWLFPEEDLEKRLKSNIYTRYGRDKKLIFFSFAPIIPFSLEGSLCQLRAAVSSSLSALKEGAFLIVQVKDIRRDGYICPLGKLVYETLDHPELWLKEIVVVAPENPSIDSQASADLSIIHQYLLIYEVVK